MNYDRSNSLLAENLKWTIDAEEQNGRVSRRNTVFLLLRRNADDDVRRT
jgi:hypothetical protein